MSSPRIAYKNEVNADHDKLVFLLSDMLFDSAMAFINEYEKQSQHEEKGYQAHYILYNALMNFVSRTVYTLAKALDDEEERKIFIDNLKKNIFMSIDMAKDLQNLDKKDLQ